MLVKLPKAQDPTTAGLGCHGDPRHLYLRGWIGRGSRKGADRRSAGGSGGGVPQSSWMTMIFRIETDVLTWGSPIFQKHPKNGGDG